MSRLDKNLLMVADGSDKWPSYRNILYCSMDYDILILQILLFTLFDVIPDNGVPLNTLTSMLFIYLIERAMREFRAWLGERNLHRKTLTDQRFLI